MEDIREYLYSKGATSTFVSCALNITEEFKDVDEALRSHVGSPNPRDLHDKKKIEETVMMMSHSGLSDYEISKQSNLTIPVVQYILGRNLSYPASVVEHALTLYENNKTIAEISETLDISEPLLGDIIMCSGYKEVMDRVRVDEEYLPLIENLYREGASTFFISYVTGSKEDQILDELRKMGYTPAPKCNTYFRTMADRDVMLTYLYMASTGSTGLDLRVEVSIGSMQSDGYADPDISFHTGLDISRVREALCKMSEVTQEQRNIIKLFVTGKSDMEIAASLRCSTGDVKIQLREFGYRVLDGARTDIALLNDYLKQRGIEHVRM